MPFLASSLVLAGILPATTIAGPPHQAKTAALPKAALELAGEVVSVEGTVLIRSDGQNSQAAPSPAKPGDSLYAGAVVNTSSNGRIKIFLKDKSIVDLGPSALFKLDGFTKNGGADRQVDVSMMYGTLRTAVTQKLSGNGRFRVRTPSATMGVRGTEFVVKSDIQNMNDAKSNPSQAAAAGGKSAPPPSNQTQITVLQGRVDVAQKEPELPKSAGKGGATAPLPKVVSLTAGTQLISKQGDTLPTKPVTLDTSQLKAISSEARVTDNTFTKAVVIEPASNENSGNGNGSSGRGPANAAPMTSIFAGSGGAATVLASAVTATVVAPPPISVTDLGIAGSFGGHRSPPPPPAQTPTGTRKLKIIISK